MKKINIILLIIWLIVIFLFSCEGKEKTTNRTNNITGNAINIYIKIFNKDYSSGKIEDIQESLFMFTRKLAHILEYLILSILVIRVFKDYEFLNKRLLLYTIIFCFMYAISDEFHQLFVKDRSGRVIDIFIDSIGFIIGSISYYKIKIKNLVYTK